MIDPMATGTVKRGAPDWTTAVWAWSKAQTESRPLAVAAQRTPAPIDAFPDEYSTAEELAADRPDADPRRKRTIIDTASRSSIDMINRLDYIDPRQPRPTDPARGPARTPDSDHGYDR